MTENKTNKLQSGFAPLILIVTGAFVLIGTATSYSIYKSEIQSQNKLPDSNISESTYSPEPVNSPTNSSAPNKNTVQKTTPSPTTKVNKVTISPSPTSSAKEFKLTSPKPTPTPPDNVAPTTNIYYPANNGSINYKIDGKVCAIATAPTDPDSKTSDIETEFKFDDGEWSGFKPTLAYLCSDTLPNGVHTLSYHSKDNAGNTEVIKTLNFTVQIAGN